MSGRQVSRLPKRVASTILIVAMIAASGHNSRAADSNDSGIPQPLTQSSKSSELGELRSQMGKSPLLTNPLEARLQPGSSGTAIDVDQMLSPNGLSSTLKIMLLLTVISLAPSILIMTTCFMRFVIVFGLLRQAMGTQQLPPNQVIVSLCLFLTFLVMSPVWKEAYDNGIQPYTSPAAGQEPITLEQAFHRTARARSGNGTRPAPPAGGPGHRGHQAGPQCAAVQRALGPQASRQRDVRGLVAHLQAQSGARHGRCGAHRARLAVVGRDLPESRTGMAATHGARPRGGATVLRAGAPAQHAAG